MNDFKFSDHALNRLLEMLVSPEEIQACLYRPDRVYPSRKYVGRMNRTAGRLTLGMADDGVTVLTAVWADDDMWRADLAGCDGLTDRKFRGVLS